MLKFYLINQKNDAIDLKIEKIYPFFNKKWLNKIIYKCSNL